MARTPEAITPSSWRKVIAIATLASVIVSIVILAFTWPTKAMESKNLPVSIAGPEAAVSQFEQGLKDRGVETFEFKQASSREDAERQIKERETYGAIVFTEGAAPEVMTAPAANASANQMLTGVAQQMNAQVQQKATAAKTQALQQAAQADDEQGAMAQKQLEQLKTEQEKLQQAQVKTTAVVPLGEGDPNGMGLAAAAFPLVMGGMLGGILSIVLIKGTWRRFVTAGLYGIIGGLFMTIILGTWFGFAPGDFGTLWVTFGVTAFATASFMIGVSALFTEAAGIGFGVVLSMFIGNPLSGVNMPRQFIPAPWGDLGQLMVPGASNTLLRNISYFPDASNSLQWAVLLGWAGFGLLAGAIGWAWKERRATHMSAEG
ncbi:ABC-2 family transporter protein [Rothia dentocariosa]|uniref:ABC-2 family transporter protein n=1 Tax=Rothia dentocariosa TaxID=2047 RepID=A0A3S4YTD9_9MICC|nr:ABC-2 family transporter protein [Rothia dentocariosa]